ncbi:hypothetical protein AB1207_22460 [Kineococcus endophyticus]|uniref:Hydrophobic W protein n=1 Tax=Kineococcus endophyticus TaxID=1181883 RepID=A0ABV3PCZ0_9ACTN
MLTKQAGRRVGLVATTLVATAMLAGGSPAFAASGGTTASTNAAAPTVVTPQSNPDCRGQWVFDNTSVKADHIGRVGAPVSNYFGSKGSMSLSIGYTGTVGASASASVTAEGSAAVFAKISATVNGTVSTSASVNTTNTSSFDVPAGRYGNGVYGRYRVAVTGDLYQLSAPVCAHKNQQRITYYLGALNKPVGWCTWTSTNPLGSRPAACDDGSPYIP